MQRLAQTALINACGHHLSQILGGYPVHSDALAFQEWPAPPIATPLAFGNIALRDLSLDIYSNSEVPDATMSYVWHRCCELFLTPDGRRQISPTLSVIFPHLPFVAHVNHRTAALNMAIAVYACGLSRGGAELSKNICRLELSDGPIGFDHRGVELPNGGYRLLPSRYIDDYASALQDSPLGEPVVGTGRLNSVYQSLIDKVPRLTEELPVIFGAIVHTDREDVFLRNFSILPAMGDDLRPPRPNPVEPPTVEQASAIQLQQLMGRL